MLPVGKWTSMEENSKGLKVEGELFALNTERGQYIYEGLKAGALDGLSIGYASRNSCNGTKPASRAAPQEPRPGRAVDRDVPDERQGARRRRQVGFKTIREFEDFLRDVGGYSHAAAEGDRRFPAGFKAGARILGMRTVPDRGAIFAATSQPSPPR
jgi:hypothetical protein